MTDTEEQDPPVHPAALLLPWYVSGQLSEHERREVELHLRSCGSCKGELDSLDSLRARIREMFEAAPEPSARVRQSVLAKVRAEVRRPRALERLVEATHALLTPRWAPAALLLLVVGQLGGLAWLATHAPRAPELTSRAVGPAAMRVRILFNPAAPEGTVRSAIHDLGGRIVDGPLPDGAYVIELSGGVPPQTLAAKLRTLREQATLVERIDAAP